MGELKTIVYTQLCLSYLTNIINMKYLTNEGGNTVETLYPSVK